MVIESGPVEIRHRAVEPIRTSRQASTDGESAEINEGYGQIGPRSVRWDRYAKRKVLPYCALACTSTDTSCARPSSTSGRKSPACTMPSNVTTGALAPVPASTSVCRMATT